MDLIQEHSDALIALRSLHHQEEDVNKLVDNVETLYRERKYALEEEWRNAINEAKKAKAIKISKLDMLRRPLKDTIIRYNRILELMFIYKDNPIRGTINDPVKILYENEHNLFVLKISKFGRYSRTTVNNYTLYLEGKSIFSELMTREEFFFYGISEIKRAPSEKALIEYMERPMNLKKIMDRIPLDTIHTLEKEYKEAIELLKDVRWQIEYLKSRKHYYEDHVSRGTEDPEYEDILRQLKELTAQ